MKFLEILNKVKSILPLEILKVDWIGEQLIIEDNNWAIVCSTAWWRIIKDQIMLLGCTDDIAYKVKELEGLSIVDVMQQSQFLKSDISLILSNGLIIELFSTSSLEPWSVTINGITIYSSPSDNNWTE